MELLWEHPLLHLVVWLLLLIVGCWFFFSLRQEAIEILIKKTCSMERISINIQCLHTEKNLYSLVGLQNLHKRFVLN